MLAFRFQLTPAQVDFLLVIYGGNYKVIDNSNSLLPEFNSSTHYVSVVGKLIAKGLATHDPTRNPTYLITDKGIAIARMIVDDAKRIASVKYKAVSPSQKARR